MGYRARWAIIIDEDDMMKIEKSSFEYPWTQSELRSTLNDGRNTAQVVENSDGKVVGYMVYTIDKTYYEIMNLAVDKEYRRIGIASMLLNSLKDRLTYKRQEIRVILQESSLDGLNFFKSQKFRAVRLIRNYYDTIEDDAIKMIYKAS